MRFTPRAWLVAVALIFAAAPARSQVPHDHSQHQHPPKANPDTVQAPRPAGHSVHDGHAGHGAHAGDAMPAMLGRYPMSREGSGTAWQPDASPHEGLHAMRGSWSLMLHGFAFLISNHQGGRRGDDELVSTNMLMGMATRPVGTRGRVGLRAMLSAEPWTGDGRRGYALLLQTGETADGHEHLVDRQHPHDLFMELAATASADVGRGAVFVYAGLPGEPALGPPAFMHRFSGVTNPASPIAHHWLDSTHITYGVLTAGLVLDGIKIEASAFRGREPDQDRADIETGPLDSRSARVAWNPGPRWSLQASAARIESPEQLAPEVDVDRLTLSAAFHAGRNDRPWQTAVAYGRNDLRPGPMLEAWLAESAVTWKGRHTAFARIEHVQKNELFGHHDPRAEEIFRVTKLGGGYVRDLLVRDPIALGVGGSLDVAIVPRDLEDEYGRRPLSAMLFVRGVLR